jgi:signal transduction histidine kinase
MKILDKILQSQIFKTSLRLKVALVFVLPMVIVISAVSYIHGLRERGEQEEQIEQVTTLVGDMTLGGLKHAMMVNDREMTASMLENLGEFSLIKHIEIVNLDARVTASTKPEDVGTLINMQETGCEECHRYTAGERPRVVRIASPEGLLRVSTPIPNDPECHSCHSPKNVYLGVLLVDVSMASADEFVIADQVYNIVVAVISILLVMVLSVLMIQWLVVKRVEVLYKSLSVFASGNFSVRVPKPWRTEDEITRLADHFNEIADALERHEKEQREIVIIRQEAVEEERERIARDLHDGLAQLLAYMNTKISATRLLLKQRRPKVADEHLAQMEEAVQKETTEVRAAIIGLKLIGKEGASLYENLVDYVNMSNRLGDLRIQFEPGPDVEEARVSPAAEIHLLRITQEAIHNIRKHASASLARIGLHKEDDFLVLTIEDNGIGFDTWQTSMWHQPHFGLRTMGERAELIGAAFNPRPARGRVFLYV